MKQRIFTLIIALIFASLTGCISKKAVNDSSVPVFLPMAPTTSNWTVQDSLGRAPTVALAGKLLLQGEIPTPLSNVQIGLYKKTQETWREITKFNSDPVGNFGVTQKLVAGSYELRIVDKRYKGALEVTLDKEPQKDLILYATKPAQ